MAASHSKILNLVATVLLGVTAIVCVSLGRWQLTRAEERREIAAVIQSGRSGNSIHLSAASPTDSLQPWRPAQAEGVWQPQFSLLLDNRNLDGRPGLWLATPLLFADGHAVLVLRGWFARPIGAALSPQIPTPKGIQKITGEIAQRVPRLFELWGNRDLADAGLPQDWPTKNIQPLTNDFKQDTASLIRLQNIDLNQLTHRFGLKFLPVVLMQKDNLTDGLTRTWPEPSVDADKNMGYAMQWFGFAAIAVIAWLGFAWRVWRRKSVV